MAGSDFRPGGYDFLRSNCPLGNCYCRFLLVGSLQWSSQSKIHVIDFSTSQESGNSRANSQSSPMVRRFFVWGGRVVPVGAFKDLERQGSSVRDVPLYRDWVDTAVPTSSGLGSVCSTINPS